MNKKETKAYKKQYYENNRETIKAKAIQYRKDNPKKVKAVKRRYYIVGRIIAVLKSGNDTIGQQSPMYDVKINTYDPVNLEKLQMELDIPWKEPVMDIHKIAQRVHKNKASTKRAESQ